MCDATSKYQKSLSHTPHATGSLVAVRAVSGGAEAVVEAGRMRMQREGSPIESLRAVAAALWASESHGSTIRDETGLDLLSERAIPAKRVGLDT